MMLHILFWCCMGISVYAGVMCVTLAMKWQFTGLDWVTSLRKTRESSLEHPIVVERHTKRLVQNGEAHD